MTETEQTSLPITPWFFILDSRLRGNDGAGGCRLKFRHSRENGNLELLIFQTTFEHCRYPMIWIPACAGMTRFQVAVSGCCFLWK
ncbi:hypothetical protein [Neisseria meningitidis]|uniref:hypothetical protein n=1 Tax=Neisseria meningitidis TaxID=487 RepID=UPI000AF894E1|nr:hypothetical protein [Neisseria meningitidis]